MCLNYRSREEILASILECAKFGARKTQIMYRANLSHGQLTTYLRHLLLAHLLTETTDGGKGRNERLYETTELGSEYLRRYRALVDLVPAALPPAGSAARTSRRLFGEGTPAPPTPKEENRYRPPGRGTASSERAAR
jgi:predicted transcriptional regulator